MVISTKESLNFVPPPPPFLLYFIPFEIVIREMPTSKLFKKLDIFLLTALPLLSTLLSIIFKTTLFVSCLLFFGIPSLYLTYRNPRIALKTCIFALIFSLPLTFIFDYLLVMDKAWYIVSSILPSRLFGVVAVEQFVFGTLCIYFIIYFYESFFDRKNTLKRDRPLPKLLLIFALGAFAIVSLMILMIFVNSPTIVIPYAYAFLGITIGVVPLIIFLYHFPHLISRFLKVTVYFLLTALLVEYVGLTLNQWIFPGVHYLWKINYLGFPIPIEELFFYFVLSTPGVLVYYEFFDDDRK